MRGRSDGRMSGTDERQCEGSAEERTGCWGTRETWTWAPQSARENQREALTSKDRSESDPVLRHFAWFSDPLPSSRCSSSRQWAAENGPVRVLPYFFWAISLALLGSFQFGIHNGVMNVPELIIRDCGLGDLRGPSGLPYCFDGTGPHARCSARQPPPPRRR